MNAHKTLGYVILALMAFLFAYPAFLYKYFYVDPVMFLPTIVLVFVLGGVWKAIEDK